MTSTCIGCNTVTSASLFLNLPPNLLLERLSRLGGAISQVAIVFNDVALSRKMHVAVGDYRYKGGIYERYSASRDPLVVNNDFINDYTLNIQDGRSRPPTTQLSGLEVLVRF